MELKTKYARKMLEPLRLQINQLQLILTDVPNFKEKYLVIRSMFSVQLQLLRQEFRNLTSEDNCDNEESNAKCTDPLVKLKHISLLNSIDLFIEQMDYYNINKDTASYMRESLLDKFTLALRDLEDLQCLPLKLRLQDCLEYVREMSKADEIEDFQNIKELGISILEILEPLQKYKKSLVSALLSERLALYISQLCTSFDMLVQLAQEQHLLNTPIYTCKKYVCGRMCTCCEMILELLDSSNPTSEEETFEKENHFVYRMDLALDIILDMPNKTYEEQLSECTELWTRLEDIFSHAMAITQVCQPYNFKAITGSCQSIVLEYEKLKQQLQSEIPDPLLNTLFMNTLTDALYRLERKVNVAILTLATEVFSKPYACLRKLVMTCGSSLNAKRRSKSDLNNLIEDFDQLFDQAMQIGIFAIACCKDTNRNNQIRNCLAGFESLETELISAITSFYLHPDNKEMRSSVKLLTAQWQLEMNKFQNVVNLIINSAAFCQVILDSLQERIMTMSDCLDNRQTVTQSQVQDIVQRASVLSSQVTVIVSDIGTENIGRQTIMMTRELKAAIYEANAASKTFLVEDATDAQQLRVIKRCELILNVIQRLQPALSTLMNNTTYEKSGKSQGDSGHQSDTTASALSDNTNFPHTVFGLPRDENSLTYIRTPYTVKAYKPQLLIQTANSVVRKPSDLSCLIPYIQSGRTLRSEHSVMYNTSHKMKNTKESVARNETTVHRNLSTIRQHLFGRDSFTVHNISTDVSQESMDLTAALEMITALSANATFSFSRSSKAQNASSGSTNKDSKTMEKSPKTTTLETEDRLSKSITREKMDECSISGGGDASLIVETCQKFNNVRLLNSEAQKSILDQQKA